MVGEAIRVGMEIKVGPFEVLLKTCSPSPTVMLHESLTGAWKALEYLPARRYNWVEHKTKWRYEPNRPRTMGVTIPYLRQSVLDRVIQDGSYWPAPMPRVPVE